MSESLVLLERVGGQADGASGEGVTESMGRA